MKPITRRQLTLTVLTLTAGITSGFAAHAQTAAPAHALAR